MISMPDLSGLPESIRNAMVQAFRGEMGWRYVGRNVWNWAHGTSGAVAIGVKLLEDCGGYAYSWSTELDCDEYDLGSTSLNEAVIEMQFKAERLVCGEN